MKTLSKPLSNGQLHLLKLFRWCDSDEDVNEMKEVLLKHFRQRVDEEMDKVRIEKGIDQQAVDQMMNAHDRIHTEA
jgi:hypothetical protein